MVKLNCLNVMEPIFNCVPVQYFYMEFLAKRFFYFSDCSLKRRSKPYVTPHFMMSFCTSPAQRRATSKITFSSGWMVISSPHLLMYSTKWHHKVAIWGCCLVGFVLQAIPALSLSQSEPPIFSPAQRPSLWVTSTKAAKLALV